MVTSLFKTSWHLTRLVICATKDLSFAVRNWWANEIYKEK
jgi:hypothetical protein